MFVLSAFPTAWLFAQTGFAPGMRRRILLLVGSLCCVAWLCAVSAFAQGIITTAAGNGSRGFAGDGGPAVTAPLDMKPFTGGVAADAAGNVYIADTGNHRVRKINTNGIISTVAGNGLAQFSGDGGPATNASLFAPTGLGVDARSNLYIVDTGNQRIRRVGPDGIITTIAGNGVRGFSGDGGMATAASLSLGNIQFLGSAGYPTSVAVDGGGNLYIADTENGRVRKVTPSGIITTVVAGLRDPYGVAVDAAGNLFTTDSSNDQILKVNPSGAVATIIGTLHSPSGVAVDSVGSLYIADSHTHRIRKVEPNGLTTIMAGSGDPIFDPFEGFIFVGGFSGDGGPATSAQLNFPWGVAADATGNVYIADSVNNRIRKVTAASTAGQHTFTNPTRIADGFSTELSPASPYPADIAVSGLQGLVTKVTVSLNNVNFGSPPDADILLVGPNGQSVILMSDAQGDGTGHIINMTLIFDDAALSSLPSDHTLRSGTYKPTNFGSETDFFPSPAPVGPYEATLSVFNGRNPNGTWSLYMVDDNPDNPFDDFGPDVEITGGWSLTIITTTPTLDPIDDAQFFVTQHYRDFLNRTPDPAGLAFWTNEITSCGTDQGCIEAKRINVSAAFFLSIEFQQTGYLVYRIYKSSYGDISGTPVPLRLSEFLPDTQEIGLGVVVNQLGWEQVLENNKQAFTSEFVQRSRFTTAFPTSMTPTEFVDKLFANGEMTPATAERTDAINEFGSANTSIDVAARARVLRRVAESSMLAQQEFNRAFVLMQYFGYLRRNPNDPPEATLDFQGYNFWLNKLNSFNGNFIDAEMVKSFLVSTEYRQRFGP